MQVPPYVQLTFSECMLSSLMVLACILQVWSLHALALIADSGGPMFRGYVEPTLSLALKLLLSVPQSYIDVHQCIGKVLSALITTVGPELQGRTYIWNMQAAHLFCKWVLVFIKFSFQSGIEICLFCLHSILFVYYLEKCNLLKIDIIQVHIWPDVWRVCTFYGFQFLKIFAQFIEDVNWPNLHNITFINKYILTMASLAH